MEAGKTLTDDAWETQAGDDGMYDLNVYGTNGFLRTFKGQVSHREEDSGPQVRIDYQVKRMNITAMIKNPARGLSP